MNPQLPRELAEAGWNIAHPAIPGDMVLVERDDMRAAWFSIEGALKWQRSRGCQPR